MTSKNTRFNIRPAHSPALKESGRQGGACSLRRAMLVLTVVRNLVSAIWLLKVMQIFVDDPPVHPSSTIASGSELVAAAAERLAQLGVRLIGYKQRASLRPRSSSRVRDGRVIALVLGLEYEDQHAHSAASCPKAADCEGRWDHTCRDAAAS